MDHFCEAVFDCPRPVEACKYAHAHGIKVEELLVSVDRSSGTRGRGVLDYLMARFGPAKVLPHISSFYRIAEFLDVNLASQYIKTCPDLERGAISEALSTVACAGDETLIQQFQSLPKQKWEIPPREAAAHIMLGLAQTGQVHLFDQYIHLMPAKKQRLLGSAAQGGRLSVLTYLEEKLQITLSLEDQDHLLSISASYARFTFWKALVDRGFQLRDDETDLFRPPTPLDFLTEAIKERSHTDRLLAALPTLLKGNPPLDNILDLAGEADIRVVQALVRAGAALSPEALLHAAYKGNVQTFRFLLHLGCPQPDMDWLIVKSFGISNGPRLAEWLVHKFDLVLKDETYINAVQWSWRAWPWVLRQRGRIPVDTHFAIPILCAPFNVIQKARPRLFLISSHFL